MYHLLFINNPFVISSSTGKHTNRDHLQKLITLKNTMNNISLTKHINFKAYTMYFEALEHVSLFFLISKLYTHQMGLPATATSRSSAYSSTRGTI